MPPVNVSLSQFIQMVDRVSESKLDSHVIQLRPQDSRLDIIESFSGALRKEFGPHVGNMIDKSMLAALRATDKPLTARMVKDLIRLAQEEKTRVNEHNSKVVGEFLSGKNPEKSLDKVMGEFHVRYGIRSPEDQALLRERIKNFLAGKAGQGGFHPGILSHDALKEGILKVLQDYTPFSAIHRAAVTSTSPGQVQDKLHLADMGLGGTSHLGFDRCLVELGSMRQIQPEGDLTPETVYKALFKENPPPGLSGGKLVEAMEKRCDAEREALLESIGMEKQALVNTWAKYIPWEKLVSLAERPQAITLDDVPNFKLFIRELPERSAVEKQMLKDLPRLAFKEGESPPTFSFQLPDGEGGTLTKSVVVGQETTFAFEDDADKAAYEQIRPSSLSKQLMGLCKEICGGEDAPETQVTGVVQCLGQTVYNPLVFASRLAGATTEDSSSRNLSLSLSRLPDGTVQVVLSSPKEMQDSEGQVSMTLQVAKNGKISLTELQGTPPLAVRQAREQDAKAAAVKLQAAPFLALDDSPGGLFMQIRDRALALDPQATLSPKAWETLSLSINQRLEKLARESGEPITQEQIQNVRKAVLDAFFDTLNQVAGKVPQEQRAGFVRGCLEVGMAPDETLLPGIRQMSGTVASTFKAILTAKDGEDVRGLLEALHLSMNSVTTLNPDFKGKGEDFFQPALLLAMRMGMQNLMGRDTPEAFAKALTQPGPFRDLLHMQPKEPLGEGNGAHQALSWLRGGLMGILPGSTLASFSPNSTPERNLSLPLQRKILGEGNYATRGAGVAVPDLARLNQSLKKDLPVLKAHILAESEKDLRLGPGHKRGNSIRTDLGLSDQFRKDYEREGIFINGRHYHPSTTKGTGTTEQGFIDLFPDAHTARLLSNLAGQNLLGMLYNASIYAQPQTIGDILISQIFTSQTMMSENAVRLQNTRIDTLDPSQGRYRLTGFQCLTSGDPSSGVERFMYEVSVVVNLGAPGTDPRPQPKVEDVQLDLLVRGREMVPGEA